MKKIYQRLGMMLLAASCFGVVQTGKAQTFLTDGLISYYPFDGNADDKVGPNDGVVNGAVLAPDMFGRPNQAYSFAGFNSWIHCPDSRLPAGNSPRTLSLWVKSTAFHSNVYAPVFACFGSGQPNDTFYIVLLDEDGGGPRVDSQNVYLCVGKSGGPGRLPNSPQIPGFQLNRWYHVTVTHDGSETRLYVDGNLKASASRTFSTVLDGNFYIGSYTHTFGWDENSDCHEGLIDNVRVYNRALSDNEISRLYRFESTLSLPLTIEVSSVQLSWPSEAGAVYEIQYSTAFHDWTPLKIIGGTGETLEYIDPNQGEKRFYRLVKK